MIINCFGEDIHVFNLEGGITTFKTERKGAVVSTFSAEAIIELDGVRFTRHIDSRIHGLPRPQEDVYLIVSLDIKRMLKGRRDLIAPIDANEDGIFGGFLV